MYQSIELYFIFLCLNTILPKDIDAINKITENASLVNPNNVSYHTSNTTNSTDVLTCVFGLLEEENPTLLAGCGYCNIPSDECSCEMYPFICFYLNQLSTKIDTTVFVTNKISYYQAIFEIFVGAVAMLGNSLVLLVNYIFYKLLSRCNKLILLLAVLDIIFALLLFIIAIPKLWTNKWIYGEIACIIGPNLQDLSVAMTTGIIMIIAVERYVGIIFPWSHWLTKTRFYMLILIDFIIATVMVIPVFMYTKLIDDYCTETDTLLKSHTYNWSLLAICFAIPLIVTSSLYIQIMLHLHRLSKSSLYITGSDRQKTKRLKDNKRILKIVVSILVAFMVLTLPNRIYWIIVDNSSVVVTEKEAKVLRILKLFGYIPYTIHVAINPFIYSIIDQKFRKRAASLCLGLCSKQRTESSTTSVRQPAYITSKTFTVELKKVGTSKK